MSCVWPDGSEAVDYKPCQPGSIASCCHEGENCLASGLCYGPKGLFYRGACTSSTYDGICQTECNSSEFDDFRHVFIMLTSALVLPYQWADLWVCPGVSSYWCGNGTICDTNDGISGQIYTSMPGLLVGTAGVFPITTGTSTAAIASASSTGTSILTLTFTTMSGNSPSQSALTSNNQSSNNTTKTALGVGLGIGLALLFLLSALLWRTFHRAPRPQNTVFTPPPMLVDYSYQLEAQDAKVEKPAHDPYRSMPELDSDSHMPKQELP